MVHGAAVDGTGDAARDPGLALQEEWELLSSNLAGSARDASDPAGAYRLPLKLDKSAVGLCVLGTTEERRVRVVRLVGSLGDALSDSALEGTLDTLRAIGAGSEEAGGAPKELREAAG